MHKELLANATLDQLKCFVDSFIDRMKLENTEIYDEAELMLFTYVNHSHFNEEMARKAVSSFKNRDGTIGSHYSLEEAKNIAEKYNIMFDNFNEYDWYFVLNMVYSDYYGAIPDDTRYYAKMAEMFLKDKDGPDGKAFKYWVAM